MAVRPGRARSRSRRPGRRQRGGSGRRSASARCRASPACPPRRGRRRTGTATAGSARQRRQVAVRPGELEAARRRDRRGWRPGAACCTDRSYARSAMMGTDDARAGADRGRATANLSCRSIRSSDAYARSWTRSPRPLGARSGRGPVDRRGRRDGGWRPARTSWSRRPARTSHGWSWRPSPSRSSSSSSSPASSRSPSARCATALLVLLAPHPDRRPPTSSRNTAANGRLEALREASAPTARVRRDGVGRRAARGAPGARRHRPAQGWRQSCRPTCACLRAERLRHRPERPDRRIRSRNRAAAILDAVRVRHWPPATDGVRGDERGRRTRGRGRRRAIGAARRSAGSRPGSAVASDAGHRSRPSSTGWCASCSWSRSGSSSSSTGLGFPRGQEAGANLLAGISAAIAAIPEEPPVLLAVILGLGAYRLLRRGVLVRRLNAEETLGAIDLIVTDKTGTLTRNRLEVVSVSTLAGLVEEPARLSLPGRGPARRGRRVGPGGGHRAWVIHRVARAGGRGAGGEPIARRRAPRRRRAGRRRPTGVAWTRSRTPAGAEELRDRGARGDLRAGGAGTDHAERTAWVALTEARPPPANGSSRWRAGSTAPTDASGRSSASRTPADGIREALEDRADRRDRGHRRDRRPPADRRGDRGPGRPSTASW